MKTNLKELSEEFSKNLKLDYDLKKKNWFNIGGNAKIFFKAENLKDLIKFLKIIENNFQNISNLAKQNKSELYLVIFPWPETLINGQSEFNWEKFADNLCAKNNCNELINLFEDFEYIRKNNQNWKNLIWKYNL